MWYELIERPIVVIEPVGLTPSAAFAMGSKGLSLKEQYEKYRGATAIHPPDVSAGSVDDGDDDEGSEGDEEGEEEEEGEVGANGKTCVASGISSHPVAFGIDRYPGEALATPPDLGHGITTGTHSAEHNHGASFFNTELGQSLSTVHNQSNPLYDPLKSRYGAWLDEGPQLRSQTMGLLQTMLNGPNNTTTHQEGKEIRKLMNTVWRDRNLWSSHF